MTKIISISFDGDISFSFERINEEIYMEIRDGKNVLNTMLLTGEFSELIDEMDKILTNE